MKFEPFHGPQRQNGQSVVLIALILCMLAPLLMVVASNMNSRLATSLKQTRLMLNGKDTMQGFATIVQRAYDLYKQQNNGTCPANTNLLAFPGQTTGFCFPQSNAALCINNYCLSNTIIASQDKANTFFEARLEDHNESKLEDLVGLFSSIDLRSLLISEAFAQRVSQRPPTPAAGSTSNTAVPMGCPGGGQCKVCGTNIHCITLQVCSVTTNLCTPSQYWVQRFGVLL